MQPGIVCAILSVMNSAEVLIIPGHATFKASADPTRILFDPVREDHWLLQSFQHGEVPYYIEHIQRGIEIAKHNPQTYIIFSGGRTREGCGNWSEAATYATIAKHYGYWQADTTARNSLATRIFTENYARDSFENLQYSLRYLQQLTGKQPTNVTVVGWEFKRQRFEFHAQTLGIPADRFSYIGCNNPPATALSIAEKGEAATVALFKQDPRGESGVLAQKRQARNPYHDRAPYDYPSLPVMIKTL